MYINSSALRKKKNIEYSRRCALIYNKKLKNLQVILKHTVTHGHDNKRRKIEGFV